MDKLIAIGELAASMGISVRAIRYYEEIGLLLPYSTSETNYRFYTEREKTTLGLILLLKQMGLSLREIKALVGGMEPDAFLKLVNQHLERLRHEQAEILLQQEIWETARSLFDGDPLGALQKASLTKTEGIRKLLEHKASVKVIGIGGDLAPVLAGLMQVEPHLDILHLSEEGALGTGLICETISIQGSSYEIGVQEELHQIRKGLQKSELLFILAGPPEPASILAREAKKLGIPTIGIYHPTKAEEDIEPPLHQEFMDQVDLWFDGSVSSASEPVDHTVHAVVGLSSLLLNTPIRIQDIQALIRNQGKAELRFGQATGANKITEVLEQLFSEASRSTDTRESASSAILTITASDELTIPEVDRIVRAVQDHLGSQINLIFGTVINPALSDTLQVSLVLAGESRKGAVPADKQIKLIIG